MNKIEKNLGANYWLRGDPTKNIFTVGGNSKIPDIQKSFIQNRFMPRMPKTGK